MASSKLTAITKINVLERDKLFFDRYEYSVCFVLEECGVLRENSELAILRAINWRNSNRRTYRSASADISPELTDDLLDMWRKLNQHRDQIKVVFSYNLVYVYGNDLKMLADIAGQSYTDINCFQQAVVTRPRDVVLKSNPKFKLRSYFKDTYLEDDKQALLRNFLTSRPDSYGFTGVFRRHLDRSRWFYLQRHHWIEHDSPADVTMLSLVVPGLIRKTVEVRAK